MEATYGSIKGLFATNTAVVIFNMILINMNRLLIVFSAIQHESNVSDS